MTVVGSPKLVHPVNAFDSDASSASASTFVAYVSVLSGDTGLRATCAALQAAGGGKVFVGPGDMTVFGVGTVYSSLGDFSGLNGVEIIGCGTRLIIDPLRVFTVTFGEFFRFAACSNYRVSGFTAIGTLTAADIAAVALKGPEFVRVEAGASVNGVVEDCVVTGLLAALAVVDTRGAKSIKNVRMTNVTATTCIYGAAGQYGPQGFTIEGLRTDNIVRSFIGYGIRGLHIEVDSKDAVGDDILFGVNGEDSHGDIEDFRVVYRRSADTAASGASGGGLTFFFGSGISFRNGIVSVFVEYPGAGTTPGQSTILWRKDGNLAHGSEFENVLFSKIWIKNYPTLVGGAFPLIGQDPNVLWPAGDFWSNVTFEDVVINASAAISGANIVTGPFVGPLTLRRVTSNADFGLVDTIAGQAPPTTGGPYRIEDCAFPNLYATTAAHLYRLQNLNIPGIAAPTPWPIPKSWHGKTITNEGAGATDAVSNLLPANAANIGLEHTFLRVDGGNHDIAPDGTDIIGNGTAGQKLRLAAKGAATLRVVKAGRWEILSIHGADTYV